MLLCTQEMLFVDATNASHSNSNFKSYKTNFIQQTKILKINQKIICKKVADKKLLKITSNTVKFKAE